MTGSLEAEDSGRSRAQSGLALQPGQALSYTKSVGVGTTFRMFFNNLIHTVSSLLAAVTKFS